MRRLAVLALVLAAPATATPLEDRLRQQLQSVTTQLRELQAGQAAAEAARTAAEKERDALKARAAVPAVSPATTRELAAARSRNAALAAQASGAAGELAQARARAAELTNQLRAAQAETAAARAAAAASAEVAATTGAATKADLDRNARLVATGRELVALHIKRYGGGDFPPLQRLRTRIENEAQAMGDRVEADRIMPNAAGPAPK